MARKLAYSAAEATPERLALVGSWMQEHAA